MAQYVVTDKPLLSLNVEAYVFFVFENFSISKIDADMEKTFFPGLAQLLKEKKYQISVEDFFKNLKVFYSYSSYKEPQKVDLRFARWIVEKESLK